MTLKDFLGINPTQQYNPFAHEGEPGSIPTTRPFATEEGTLYLDLDPRATPMRAVLSREDGTTIATAQGISVLLAYCAQWKSEKQKIYIRAYNGDAVPKTTQFQTYYDHCLCQYRKANKDDYQSLEDEAERRQLDTQFLAQHIEKEMEYRESATELNSLIYEGELLPVVDEYLAWILGKQKGKNVEEGIWLKGCRTKLNVCVKKNWLIKDGEGYKKAEGLTENALAAIIGQIFFGDRYNTRSKEITKGKDHKVSIKQIETMFRIKNLSQKRAKLKAETYGEYYIS